MLYNKNGYVLKLNFDLVTKGNSLCEKLHIQNSNNRIMCGY